MPEAKEFLRLDEQRFTDFLRLATAFGDSLEVALEVRPTHLSSLSRQPTVAEIAIRRDNTRFCSPDDFARRRRCLLYTSPSPRD